jgi:RNA polymerase sigma factor (sigma-70 family)
MEPIEAHLREVYQRHAQHIARHLEFLLGNRDDAWEITQEAFARYVAFLRRGGEPRSPFQVLHKTATRLALRRLRRRRYRLEQYPRILAGEANRDNPHQNVFNQEILSMIWKALDARGKVVLKACLIDQMTDLEIARYTGIPRASVQRRIKKIQSIAEKSGVRIKSVKKKNGQNEHPDASNTVEGPGKKKEDPGDS